MIHVVWRASVSVQHLKPRAPRMRAGYIQTRTRSEHKRIDTHMSFAAPTADWTNILVVSPPPLSWRTWKGLPGPGTMVTDAPCTQWMLRWAQCRIVFPEPQLDTITIFNGMFTILLSLSSSLKASYSLCGVTALSCQNSAFFQDSSQPWRRRLLQEQPILPLRMRGCCS